MLVPQKAELLNWHELSTDLLKSQMLAIMLTTVSGELVGESIN